MTSDTSSPETLTAAPSISTAPGQYPNHREESLRTFSKLLGAKSDGANLSKSSGAGVIAPELDSSYKILQKYLVHEPLNPTGGATCAFPSLDLYSGQVAGLPLPNVGSSARSNPLLPVSMGSSSPSPDSPQMKIPTMAASVFNAQGNGMKRPTEAQAQAACDAAMLEQAAARNLGSITTWTRSTIHLAPITMLKSLSASFSALVDARVRAWMLLFLRQSLTTGDEQSRSQLLKLLATSQSIDIKSVATSFTALTLPPSAFNQEDAKASSQIILPLLFEVVSNVVLHEEKVVAKLRAPGTLLGVFDSQGNSSLMKEVKINLDTKALVASMVEQARLVVFKAVASATSLPLGAPSPQRNLNTAQQQQHFQAPPKLQKSTIPMMTASIGAMALASTPEVDDEKEDGSVEFMQETRAPQEEVKVKGLTRPKSVLKMPSRGVGSTNGLSEHESLSLKPKKTRSITWSNCVDVSKKKDEFPSLTLKSSKSFGKPDANTFSTSRNATFAEFGRSVNQAAQHTFVNGKLKVNTNAVSMANFSSNGSSSNNESFVLKRNAEFSAASLSMTTNLNRRGNSLAGLAKSASAFERAPRGAAGIMPQNLSLGLTKSTTFKPKEMENIPQPMLPRTPTALEGLLLQKAQARFS